MWQKETFRKIKHVIANTVASTTLSAVSKLESSNYMANMELTITVSTGNVYISPLTTDLTSTNGFYLEEGDTMNIMVPTYLAILGDSTTAAYRAIIWDPS